MIVNPRHDTIALQCDSCGEISQENPREEDFKDNLSEWKGQGWRVVKGIDDKWEHYCPECAE